MFIILALCYYCILDILRRELSPFCAWGRVSTWDCFLVSTSRDSVHSLGIVLSNLGLPINKIAKVSYWKSSSIKRLYFLNISYAQDLLKLHIKIYFLGLKNYKVKAIDAYVSPKEISSNVVISLKWCKNQMFSNPIDISILFSFRK